MRIWTRKSASIQPRTSLGKSAVSWPQELRRGCEVRRIRADDLPWGDRSVLIGRLFVAQCRGEGRGPPPGATTHHSFRGSFSAGSKPIFASKYAFFSIFQNLQENHFLASKFSKFLPKNWKILQNFDIFGKFCIFLSLEQNFS